MDNWELIGTALGTIIFLVWILSMVSWIRQGVTIPRYIHVTAIVLTSISIGCLVGMLIGGLMTLNLALALILVPPAITYFGWFWLFGPEFSKVASN